MDAIPFSTDTLLVFVDPIFPNIAATSCPYYSRKLDIETDKDG